MPGPALPDPVLLSAHAQAKEEGGGRWWRGRTLGASHGGEGIGGGGAGTGDGGGGGEVLGDGGDGVGRGRRWRRGGWLKKTGKTRQGSKVEDRMGSRGGWGRKTDKCRREGVGGLVERTGRGG